MSDGYSNPCKACPWRAANQGKRHPDGWYTRANLRRLWTGMKTGEGMTCHPTDPNNEVSEKAQGAGYKAAPEHAKVAECAGVTILKQREYMRFQDDHDGDYRAYRAVEGPRMTREGLFVAAMRAGMPSNPFTGERMPKVNLNDSSVQYGPLGEWTPR